MRLNKKLTLPQLTSLINTNKDEQLRSDCVKALGELKLGELKKFGFEFIKSL